jgi:CheY-like chemotaxis protein
MNSLLIYNNNINQQIVNQFEETCGETVPFNIGYQEIANPNFSFDKKVTEILNQFESHEFDVIFIPFSLSEENYIEFLGLQFAYHIRLTQSFNNTRTPIVFFGNESPEIINKITNAGVILFTPGVYCTTKSNVLDFKKQIAHILENKPKITKDEYYSIFLERIHIQPPANYSTHHSIANEWSILRWAKAMSVNNDDDISNIESKIGSSLYFKFLTARYPIKATNIFKANDLKLNNNGKILYIDDEAEKGWSELFSHLLYDKCKLKDFDGELGYEFKGKEKQEIIDLCFEKVIQYKPDLVILDLRLHDEDFEVISPKEISGFQILKKIKEHNKGIQVIVFSATNKIWNLLELQKEGADGFILKESPELSVDSEFTKQSIVNICKTIDECLEMKFLIELDEINSNLENHLNTISNSSIDKGIMALSKIKLKNEIKLQIDIIYDCLKNTRYSEKKENYLNLSFISIYKIIELINDYYIYNMKKNYVLKSSGNLIQKFNSSSNIFENLNKEYPTTMDKIFNVIGLELNLKTEAFFNSLLDFNSKRNNIVHPKDLSKYYKATTEDNLKFLSIIKEIIIKIK